MTPGQAAFEKWAEELKWDALPQISKDRWEEIALAALKEHWKICSCDCPFEGL